MAILGLGIALLRCCAGCSARMAQWMRRAGLGDSPRTLLEEFAKIKSGDVVLPAQMADGRRRTIHLRCVTTPDEAQKVLLNRLGLTLPQRLRRIDEVAQM